MARRSSARRTRSATSGVKPIEIPRGLRGSLIILFIIGSRREETRGGHQHFELPKFLFRHEHAHFLDRVLIHDFPPRHPRAHVIAIHASESYPNSSITPRNAIRTHSG